MTGGFAILARSPQCAIEMRTILASLLWPANAAELRDVRSVLALGITAVVDLAASEPPVVYPRDIVYLRIPLNDGAGNPQAVLRLAINSTADLIRAGRPMLVACNAGMSRSPAIVAAARRFLADRLGAGAGGPSHGR